MSRNKGRLRGKGLQQQKLTMRREVERLSRAGMHREAIDLLNRLVSESPKNPLIWNDLGVEYAAAGDLDEAIAVLRQGRAVYVPTFPPILFNLGKFLLQRFLERSDGAVAVPVETDSLSEAIRLLNAALDRDPERIDAHALLVIANERAGQKDIAEAHRRIIEELEDQDVAFD